MPEDQPIGVFDSGVGGLTVVRELLEKLPHEKVVYIGDTAHVPYGSRTVEELKTYADQIVRFLIEQSAKLVVAACNTSSAVSLDYLRQQYTLPIVGVIEPGIRRALSLTNNFQIGVIATETTIKSGAFPQIARRFNPQVRVFGQACPQLVPLVESGELEGMQTEKTCRGYLEPLLQAGIDTLILGCTHYPFLQPVLQRIVGDKVRLIDPAQETVEEVKALLHQTGKLNPVREGCMEHQFFSTGSSVSFLHVGQQMVGKLVQKVEQVNLG